MRKSFLIFLKIGQNKNSVRPFKIIQKVSTEDTELRADMHEVDPSLRHRIHLRPIRSLISLIP